MRTGFFSYVAASVGLLLYANAEATEFHGDFIFRWLESPGARHREMELQSEVSFTDKAGKTWTVPALAKIDGASIPPFLWTFAGSPFVGNYRRASVIHDHFCEAGGATTEAINNMFFEAMLTDGVPYLEALSKYGAVYLYQETPLGTCGKESDPQAGLGRLSIETGFELTAEAQSRIQNLNAVVSASRNAGNRIEGLIEDEGKAIAQRADIASEQTFQALLVYRDNPSAETYERLETAVKAERPSEAQFEQMMYMAAMAVPPG